MEDTTNNMTVPYIVFEGTQARNERMVKRLVITIIVAIALLFISNAAWLYAWMQYDYVSEDYSYEYSQDGMVGLMTDLTMDHMQEAGAVVRVVIPWGGILPMAIPAGARW